MNIKRISVLGTALAVAALVSVGSASYADPGNPYLVGGVSQENTGNSALIKADATVRLSIHKHLGTPVSGLPNNGTEQTVGLPTLQGVKFDVYRITGVGGAEIDPSTNAGLQTAGALSGKTLTKADVAAGSFTHAGNTYGLQFVEEVTTGAGGLATFTRPNGVGIYAVAEDLAGNYPVTSSVAPTALTSGQVTPAAPFLVMLPLTNPTDLNRWMYDVNVYPKNQSDTITKTVVDGGTQSGDANGPGAKKTVVYQLNSTITDGLTAGTMGTYKVVDQLDPKVTLADQATTPVTVAIDADGNPATTNDRTALILTNDYALSTTGGKVVVTMTPAGLAKMVTANTTNSAATVLTTITAAHNATSTNGTLTNTAGLVPNQSWVESNPGTPDGIPSNPVESRYGSLQITKRDADVTSTLLAGAEFAVFADANNNEACDSTEMVDANRLYNAKATLANGQVNFTGLQVSSFYNGATQSDLLTYCLVETKAPTGYTLLPQPIAFTVTSTTAAKEITVDNEKSNLGNGLPLTGGQGIALISALGGALIVGGFGYYIVSGRRREDDITA